MKIKYIFFDFDGVLAESVNIKTEAFRQMYLSNGVEFAQRVVNHHLANGGVSRYEKFKIYDGEWLGKKVMTEDIKTLADTFSKIVLDGVVNAKEVDGASEFLNTSSDYVKYIITGTPTIEIKPILERRKMDHFFKGIYGSPENKDFWVKNILSNEKISPDECIFVGDALADYKAAIANDIIFILRETDEAMHLFDDFNGYRIKNLLTFHKTIDEINNSRC